MAYEREDDNRIPYVIKLVVLLLDRVRWYEERKLTMGFGAFTDKKHQPTKDEILEMIGAMRSAWQELIRYIRENYPSDEDFKFLYGKNYGWALRFRIRGKLLTSLYPSKDGFTVQINLSPAAIEQTQRMRLGKNAQGVIARANPYPEGRWLFITVSTVDDVQDIHKILALRVHTRRLQ
jgi:hypothetical protein